MAKNKKEITIRSSAAEYLTFVAASGDDKNSVEVRYEDENIWITQKMLATLYEVDVRTINEHIQKIYADLELEKEATIRNFRIVQTEWFQPILILQKIWQTDTYLSQWKTGKNVLIPLLKCLSTVYCKMQEKLLQRLQSFMQKLSLKSIELFRISFIKVILIDSWKNQINLRFQTK